MKVQEVLQRLRSDGWVLVTTKGSHRQFKHPTKPGRVTVAGKPSVEVRTSQWPEIKTANATVVDHVVFLNRKYADTQELIPLRPATVWPWFTQHLMAPPETRAAQEAALSQLLAAGVFELRYKDLAWAIDRINQLAQKGY